MKLLLNVLVYKESTSWIRSSYISGNNFINCFDSVLLRDGRWTSEVEGWKTEPSLADVVGIWRKLSGFLSVFFLCWNVFLLSDRHTLSHNTRTHSLPQQGALISHHYSSSVTLFTRLQQVKYITD